jgi:hypothetical protein
MDKRIWAGIITGLIYGVAIFWGAVYQSLPVGGLVALAAGAIGLAGGLIGGALLYLMVAVCPDLQRKETALPERGEEYRAAA